MAYMVSFFSFMVLALLIGYSLRRNTDILSPARIFSFIWLLAIGLAELKLSRLQQFWKFDDWLIVLMGPVAFLIGIYIVYILNFQSKHLSIDTIRSQVRSSRVDANRIFFINVILFILFLIGYVAIYLLRGEIPLFSPHPGYARIHFQLFALGLFLHNVVIIVFFTVVYHLLVKGSRGKKAVLILFSIFATILYSITLQRFQIIMTVIVSITLIYYTTRHLRFSTLSIYFAAAILFFYLVSTARGGQLYTAFLYVNSSMKFSPSYAFFTEPYMYLVMNLENFVRAVRHLDQFMYGYYTFDFVTALTGLKHWFADYFMINDTPYLVSGYNTYTTFWWFYRDFGIAGIAIISFCMGFVIGWIYNRLRKQPSLEIISTYCVCVFVMVFSFYHNLISLLWFVYNVIVMYLTLRFIHIKPVPMQQLSHPTLS